MSFISDLLKENNQLFIGLTETWLKDHQDSEISIDGYVIFRSDRVRQKKSNRGRESGRVAFYVRKDLAKSMEVLLYSNGVIEILCIYSLVDNLIPISIYRQPDDKVGKNKSTSTEFKAALTKLKQVFMI